MPPLASTSVTDGTPRVMVPVLSRTIVVELVGGLQGLAALDQDAVLGAAAGADHDRGRSGQPQGAGAGDDQHGDEGDQAMVQPGLRRRQVEPDDKGRDGNADDHRHEDAAITIRQPLNGRLAALGLLHQPHDLLRGPCPCRPWWRGSGRSRSC